MSVQIALAAQIAELAGGPDSVMVEGRTVKEALRRLTERLPKLHALFWRGRNGDAGELNPALVVFVNGEDLRRLGGLDAALRPGDKLLVISAVEGG